jgi:hypothetical protein
MVEDAGVGSGKGRHGGFGIRDWIVDGRALRLLLSGHRDRIGG